MQNPFVESFGSRVRDEVISVEAFDYVREAQTVINDWRTIYNHKRPYLDRQNGVGQARSFAFVPPFWDQTPQRVLAARSPALENGGLSAAREQVRP